MRVNLKALIEQKNAKIDRLDALLKKAEEETRALNSEENAEFERLEGEVRALEDTIQKAERAEAMERVKSGETTMDQEERATLDKKNFLAFLRGEQRALGVADSSGGKVIPETIADKIIETVKEICPIYNRVTVYNVGGDLVFPVYDETSDKTQAGYIDDLTELTEHSAKFTTITLTNFIVGALTLVSKSLLNRTDFDLTSYIVMKTAQAFTLFIEGELLKGTSSKMEGVCNSQNIVTAASATAITADELIDLQDTIPDQYQTNACWIMNKKTRNAIRKLKDTEGNYLLNRDLTTAFGYNLLGKPVFISDNMAEISASAVTIAYGDMSGLYLKFAQQLEIQVLNEHYATKHAVGVIGYAEMDSKIVEPQKLAVLKMGAGG